MTTTFDNTKATKNDPYATSTTTPPRDTFHEVTVASGDGVLMYWPEQNGFLALFPEEYRAFYAEADEHSKKIEKLQNANRKVTEAALLLREAHKRGVAGEMTKAEAALQQAISDMQMASIDVKKTLQPLSRLDVKGGVKMVELVSLKKPKQQQKAVPIYVKSTTIQQVLAEKRIYLLEGEKQKRDKEKVLKDGKLNTDEIKQRIAEKVQDKTKFSKKWKLKPDDAEAYSGVLSEWARTMNGDAARFIERSIHDLETQFNIDPNDPHRNIDLSAEAQLLRYTGGAGLEINFNPFKGNLLDKRDGSWPKNLMRGAKSGEFGIKANAQASFAIAEGRVRTSLYYPHYAGWHATAEIASQVFELGYWRFSGDIILSGGVGASLAVEVDVGISYTGGKQGLRGIPPEQKDKAGAKVHAGTKAELDAFAGGRAGVDAKGALQWLNPEGASSQGKPMKIKPNEAIAEFKDVAKVDPAVSALAGIGLKGAYQIKHEKGKFVIYVKMGLCLGLGLGASMKFEVGMETIGEFFKCVAYQLKRADYHKIADAIELPAYNAYCQIKYLVIANGSSLEDFVNKSQEALVNEYQQVSSAIDDAIKIGAMAAEEFVRRIRSELQKQTSGWLSYAPPEVIGKIQLQVASIGRENAGLQGQAHEIMALALGAPQTTNQLETIAEHMTPRMGDKQDKGIGFAMIQSCLQGTQNEGCLADAERRLAQAEPLMSKPFIWNSEPEFIAAKLAIEHPMYV
jgi:hypothetical protein